jgi:uncharacterized protein YndB with AHSA1/START domain
MWKKIVRALGAMCLIFLAFCIFIGLQPSAFSIERSATIAAPPATVFAQVNDLRAWDAWSPWKELDPSAKTTISTPSAGKGATFSWNGNDEIGEGSLTILDSKPDELVVVEQAFVRPFAGSARMAFTFVPEESETNVTWKLAGTNDFLGKVMCIFIDMDAMLGKDFERGLANMKAAVEKSATAEAP